MLESLRHQVLAVARQALDSGLVRGSEGNFSVRDPLTGYIVVTPTGVPYTEMAGDDVVVIDDRGRTVWAKPGRAPTSETPLHTLLYRERPDVGAVVHTHSPYGIVLAVAQQAIPPITIPLATLVGSRVPVARYCPPGTDQLGLSALRAMDGGRAVLLGSHGALAVGPDLPTAAAIAQAVEDAARIYYMATVIGKPYELRPTEIDYLVETAQRYGRREG